MKVLFLHNIKSVAQVGDIKDVADGYARNYLFPRGLATMATKDSIKHSDALKAEHAKELELQKDSAQKLATQINGTEITIEAEANPEGHLYGSISASDIADGLESKGFGIDSESIVLEEPIKELGEYAISIELFEEITASIKLTVSSKTA